VPPDGPILAARGLRAERAGKAVLDGVDLDVPAGAVTALMGPSGSGKTSLLRCLVRLDEPVAGRVTFEGEDFRSLDACLLRRRVALVAQSPAMLPGDVRANLAYGLDIPQEDELHQALAAAGLPAELLDRDAARLSGGETARVAVARALTRSPRVLLLDEPTASLDGRAAAGIEALTVCLAARGLAVLVVTHDEAQSRRIASRAVRLLRGKVKEEGELAIVGGAR